MNCFQPRPPNGSAFFSFCSLACRQQSSLHILPPSTPSPAARSNWRLDHPPPSTTPSRQAAPTTRAIISRPRNNFAIDNHHLYTRARAHPRRRLWWFRGAREEGRGESETTQRPIGLLSSSPLFPRPPPPDKPKRSPRLGRRRPPKKKHQRKKPRKLRACPPRRATRRAAARSRARGPGVVVWRRCCCCCCCCCRRGCCCCWGSSRSVRLLPRRSSIGLRAGGLIPARPAGARSGERLSLRGGAS